MEIILTIVQFVELIVVGAFGWILKREFKKNERNSDEISRLETKMAEEYVRKDDYNLANGEVLRRLDKIQDTLLKAVSKGSI